MFDGKGILLSCTSGLVSVDDQASTVRLIYFTSWGVSCNIFIIHHSIMAIIGLRSQTSIESVDFFSHSRYHAMDTTSSSLLFISPGVVSKKEILQGMKHIALPHLQRSGNSITAIVFLGQYNAGPVPWVECHKGRIMHVQGFTGLQCIA